MNRRELLALLPGTVAALSTNMAAPAFAGPRVIEVNVKNDFGARGNGVTDDWQAIENAGLFLEARGGGRMYFPGGRYRMPTFGKNITARNNIEYYGDGYSSVILGSNAGFISPNGAIFGRNSYGSYTYFPAHDVNAGDQSIRTVLAQDADTFQNGDIIIARSTNAIEMPNDVIPYYVEMNRVLSAANGVLALEDPIDDGWSGVMIAKVTGDISQGYNIHDLRIECETGFPIFIQGSYKALIHNCWTRGLSVVGGNGFTRSVARDIVATVLWTADGMMGPIIEIETGSVRALVENIDVKILGTFTPGKQYPLFYCQEFSRRSHIRNVRVNGDRVSLASIMMIAAGGHSLEDIHVTAQSFDKVLDYWSGDPKLYYHNHLPALFKEITIDALNPQNGFSHGFVLLNGHQGGTVENVTVQDCVVNGTAGRGDHNLIWLLQGEQKNILFRNVRGDGDVRMGAAGAALENSDDRTSRPPLALKNVEISHCEYRRIASRAMLDSATFTNCARLNSRLPDARHWPSSAIWSGHDRNRVVLNLVIPANAAVCWGDHVVVELSAVYPPSARAAHVAIKVFGGVVFAIELKPSVHQEVDVYMRVDLAGSAFMAPDKYSVTGNARLNDATVPDRGGSGKFDPDIANAVEIQAWIEDGIADGSGITLKQASIEYICVEA